MWSKKIIWTIPNPQFQPVFVHNDLVEKKLKVVV